jgi:ribosomal protein S18 acetylase RimI-like enzyme
MSADGIPIESNAAPVRRADRRDFADIRALFRLLQTTHARSHPRIFAPPVESELHEDDFRAALEAPDMLLVVAERDGAVVAAAQASVVDIPGNRALLPRRVAYVTHLITEPSARRRGHGRALMSEIAAWARSRGAETVELYVWEGSAEAMAFYRALGYRPMANLLAFKP